MKSIAKEKRITFTELVRDSLSAYLEHEKSRKPQRKQLEIQAYGKGGYTNPDFAGNWAKLRNEIYRS